MCLMPNTSFNRSYKRGKFDISFRLYVIISPNCDDSGIQCVRIKIIVMS